MFRFTDTDKMMILSGPYFWTEQMIGGRASWDIRACGLESENVCVCVVLLGVFFGGLVAVAA